MKKDEFKQWLKGTYSDSVISTRVANVSRINSFYDIDWYYLNDKVEDLLDLFEYTRKDEKDGKEPAVAITINGDYYTGISTLKSALKLYLLFLSHTNIIGKKGSGVVSSNINVDTPIFRGTLKEFTTFIGPYCRNLVNGISRSERKKHHGICEYCGKGNMELQSAHKTGEERPQIIQTILDTYYKSSTAGVYEIPLNDFESKFRSAHLPISDHIFFLCSSCHNEYDKKGSAVTTAKILAKRKP